MSVLGGTLMDVVCRGGFRGGALGAEAPPFSKKTTHHSEYSSLRVQQFLPPTSIVIICRLASELLDYS